MSQIRFLVTHISAQQTKTITLTYYSTYPGSVLSRCPQIPFSSVLKWEDSERSHPLLRSLLIPVEQSSILAELMSLWWTTMSVAARSYKF